MDFRFGLRMLRKSPGFTAAAIISLALGIGANTAIFSLIDAVMLKMLPVEDPEHLVTLTDPGQSGVSIGMSDGVRGMLSTREFEGLRERTQSFNGVFAVQSQMGKSDATIGSQGREDLRTRLVSPEYFTVLGVHTAAGRVFTIADDHGPGTAPYAVASFGFWQRRFGGSPEIFQKEIRIDHASLRIIGIAEPRFQGENVGQMPDLWIPMSMQPLIMPGRDWLRDDPNKPFDKVMWLQMIGRLKPGVSVQQAKANANVVFHQIVVEEFAKLPPDRFKESVKQSLDLHPAGNGLSSLRGDFAEPLYVLLAISGMVLLIACANVANLLLARAASRQKEIGIRIALGAKRSRVIKQFLAESILLSCAGACAGVLVAFWGIRILLRMAQSGSTPIVLDVTPDWRVLAFTITAAFLTGIAFGLAPAWRSLRVNVSNTLKEAGRGMTASSSRIGLGKSLVIAQIAVSVMLLIGAGWFVRTLRNLENVNLGYSRDKLAIVSIDPLSAGYHGARLPALYHELHSRLKAIPGVRSVAYSQNGLFSGSESGDEVAVEGYTAGKKGGDGARFDQIGPGYFSSLGIPILLGREIEQRDTQIAPRVCLVNSAFVKHFFGKTNPIGKHVTDLFPGSVVTMEIVGVAADVRDHGLRGEIPPRFYLPVDQPLDGDVAPFTNFEIRASSDLPAVMQSARKAISDYNPALRVSGADPLTVLINNRLTQERLIAQLSAGFGVLALLLGCIGLYGVLSYSVAMRTNEIGVRMALGAQRGRVVLMILKETSVLLLIGLIVGVPVALGCARFVESKMYGLKPADPVTLGVAIGVMAIVAALSGYLPARRASRTDPMRALHYE